MLMQKNRPRRDVFRVSRSNLMGSSRDFDMFENTESGQPPLPTPSQGFLGIEIEIYLVFNAILSKLLVNMVRTTGIGSSSLVSAL